MINKNNFYGKLNEVKADDFYRCLDYNLKADGERLQNVNDMFYPEGNLHPFWEDVFVQPENGKGNINLLLNSKDTQYSESNIATVLDTVGTYLLQSHMNDKKNDVKYKIFTDYRMFKEATRHLSYDQLTEDDEDFFGLENQMLFYKDNTNYKKEIKQVIRPEDYKDALIGDTLSDYRRLSDSLTLKLEVTRYFKTLSKEEIDANELPNEFIEGEKRRAGLYNKQKGLLQMDMIGIKDMLKKPIYFKQVTTSQTPDNEPEFEFNYWDMEMVRLLAKIVLSSCKYDVTKKYVREFDVAYETVKESLDEEAIDLFEIWREDGNLQAYADIHSAHHNTVHKRVKSTLLLIQRQMIENYELDYYYTELVRGKWKTCSKCGEVKIANEYYFNRDKSKVGGFKYECKKCENERKR